MTALLEAPTFVQPAYVNKPYATSSLLPKVRRVCQLLGEELEPEQEFAIEVLTGRKADGTPSILSAAVICARQNLKTFCLERIVLTLLLEPQSDVKLILWTSQQLDTCDETFGHFAHWFSGRDPVSDQLLFPFFAELLDPEAVGDGIDRGKGSKTISLKGNRRLKFKARSARSGQGLTGDVVVFDEAFALDPEHTSALLPTLSTRRRAMVLYGSSACHEESEVLRGIVERGRKGGPGAPAYVEWCAPGSFNEPGCADPGCQHMINFSGCVLDDQAAIQAANPMAGRRISWDYLQQERRELQPPSKFARERLGWHDNPLSDLQPISVESWDHLVGDPPQNPSEPFFFIDASPNLKSASIAGATSYFGRPYVQMAEYRSGTDWLPAKIAELQAKYPRATWGFESNSPFSALATENEMLKRWEFGADSAKGWPGIVVEHPITANDLARGCVHLQKLVNDELLTHSGDPIVRSALMSAIKRDMGDPGLWSWGRKKSGGDISPLVSTTGALWLMESQPQTAFFFARR